MDYKTRKKICSDSSFFLPTPFKEGAKVEL